MALHKAVKKDEDQALARIATSFGEQSLVTKGAEKFNDVRSTLDTKLNNAYSYVVLAAAISSTASSLYLLTKEYKDFTVNTYKYVTKEAFCRVVLCRRQPCHSTRDKARPETLRYRGRLRHKPHESLDGREDEPCHVVEGHHRERPADYRQRQPVVLPHDKLRLEA